MITLAALVALAAPAFGQEEEPKVWQKSGWGWGALPAVNYNSDEGFGAGALGSLYRYDGEHNPYKTAVDLILFASTKAVHSHSLQIDTLDVGDQPIRLTIRADLAATRASNYCGVGPDASCDVADAEAALDLVDPALVGADYDDALRRYYKVQFVYPQLKADMRWAVDPMPHKVEVLAGWRGGLLIPGTFADDAPFENSLYAADYAGGERERTSVLQAGLMVDNRDFEPAPSRGYWVEGSVRGASPYWGGTYGYFGFNTTLRGYVPLGTDRLVFADRFVFDGMVGDAPTVEMAFSGGLQRYDWYGSLNAGRGIRLRRYIGRIKAMNQAELRWTFAKPEVFGVEVGMTAVGFSDLGAVAEGWDTLDELGELLPGQGAGLRLAFDGNFIVRADFGFSALEGWSPGVYIDVRNTF